MTRAVAWLGGPSDVLALARLLETGEPARLCLPPHDACVPDFVFEDQAAALGLPWTRADDAETNPLAARGAPTQAAWDFIWTGHRAVVVEASHSAARRAVGRVLDPATLVDLESSAPAGSWRAFAFDGPVFRRRVDVTVGDVVAEDGCFRARLGLRGC